MRQILKFQLKILDRQLVVLPIKLKTLHFAMQNNVPTLWAEVEDSGINDGRLVVMYYTGEEVVHTPGAYDFLGTLFYGNLVLHFYIEK